MSFILDALRKSEHERQRQTGPALVEVAVAAPKPRPNRWASAAIALLLVNLVAIGVLLLMKARDEPAAAVQVAAENPAAVPPAAAAGPAAAAPAPAAQASVTQALPEPTVMAPSAPAAPVAGTRNPLEQEMTGYVPPMEREAAVAAASPPPGPGSVTTVPRGSVVYQSLPEASPEAAYAPPPAAASALPRADELAARGSLPELRLELHVWSTKPAERFVFINGRRYREGDTTADGQAVVEITRDGVVMSAAGNRFLLSRD